MRPIKILTFTTLFPNNKQPNHGIFVENRLRQLLASGGVESRVVAPVAWFPSGKKCFGEYSVFADIVSHEKRHGILIDHPKYLVIPKIGMTISPFLLALAALPTIKAIIKEGYDFDLIDAHYFYPDGVAAIILGKMLSKKVVITARGTDINLIPQYVLPKKMILWAANNSSAMITVCSALKNELVKIGVEADNVTVLRNGVDLERFVPPNDFDILRKKKKGFAKTLLSVGHLIERKGHHLVIESLKYLPTDVTLQIAGVGPEEKSLKVLAEEIGVIDRVRFLGLVPHSELKDYYGAVDVTVLASSREGWANVLLESMACGTPVVATDIWGTPEVVHDKVAGVLAPQRAGQSIAEAITTLLEHYPDRLKTRKYAEQFSWNDTTEGQVIVFKKILGLK